MRPDDYIILIHRFGYETLGQKVLRSDLYKFLEDNGIDTKLQANKDGIEHVIRESYTEASGGGNYMEYKLIYKSEAYYRYLEFLELMAANENAKSAKRSSVIAIGIASVFALIQIIVGVVQIQTTK